MIYVRLLGALLVPALAGAGVVAALTPKSAPRRLAEFLGLSFVLGFGLVGLASVALMLSGIRIGPWLPLALGAAGLVLLAAVRPSFAPREASSRVTRAAHVSTLLVFGGILFGAASNENLGWDAEIFWSLKGRSIQRYGTFRNPDFLSPEAAHVNNSYPLVLPSIYAWIYEATGTCSGRPVRLAQAFFYLASLPIVWAALRRRLPADFAAWLTTLFALTPMFERLGGGVFGGYADYPLGVFVLVGILSATDWLESGAVRSLLLGAVAFACASQTKNEGSAFMVVLAFVVALFGLRHRGWRGGIQGLAAAIPGLVLFGLWSLAKRALPPGTGSTTFAARPVFGFTFEGILERAPIVASKFFEEVTGTARWHFFWPLLLVLLLVRFPRPKHPLSLLAWAAMGQLVLYAVVWFVDQTHQFEYWNAHRLLLHLFPALFVWAGCVLAPWATPKPETPAAKLG